VVGHDGYVPSILLLFFLATLESLFHVEPEENPPLFDFFLVRGEASIPEVQLSTSGQDYRFFPFGNSCGIQSSAV
jgi:hypothetical protein